MLCLLAGQRCQTVHSLGTDYMDLSESKCIFVINHILKNTKPGTHIKPLEYFAFEEDERLCAISSLKCLSSQDQTIEEAVFTAIDQLC